MGDRWHRRAARQRDVRAARGARGGRRLERAGADRGSRAVDPARGARPPRHARSGGRGRTRRPSRRSGPCGASGCAGPRAACAASSSTAPGLLLGSQPLEPQGRLPRLRRRVPRAAAVRGDGRGQPGDDPAAAPRRLERPGAPRSSATGSASSCWRWAGSAAIGERGPQPGRARAVRGALFLSHWLLVVPVVLLRIAFGPATAGFVQTPRFTARRTDDARRARSRRPSVRVVLAGEPDRRRDRRGDRHRRRAAS